MRTEFAASFTVAVLCHALLLFGIRLDAPARPLALSNDPSPVDVSLVEAAPEPPSAASAQPPPAPEPVSTPEPMPTPEPPTPASTPDMSAPAPEPIPPQKEDTMATPAPEPPREKPKLHSSSQKHSRSAIAPSTTSNTAFSNTPNTGPAGAHGPLGSHARYRSNPKPDYPPDSLQRREEGLVILTVEVSADGRASTISLKRSSGHPLLDQAAIEGVRRWTFEPARAAGLPVASRVDVPVRFSLSDYSH